MTTTDTYGGYDNTRGQMVGGSVGRAAHALPPAAGSLPSLPASPPQASPHTPRSRLAMRCEGLELEEALVQFERATRREKSGREVLHLEIGQPGYSPRASIVEAGVRAIRGGLTGYAPPLGLPSLRATVAASLSGRGLTGDPSRVVITPGAKPVLFYAAQALLNPGDEALVPDPGFPIYRSAVSWAGGTTRVYQLDAANGFRPDIDSIEAAITHRTRVIFLNTPHNPTGGVATTADLQRIADLARDHDLFVVSDEIYSELRYDSVHLSIAALPGMAGRTVLVDGFSKAYAMTGWRLGYGYLPRFLVDAFEKMIVNTVSCVPPFVQHAGAAALSDSGTCFQSLVGDLRARRDLLVSGLNAIDGVTCGVPEGTFYAFADLTHLLQHADLSADRFVERLLVEEDLAVLSGTAFGECCPNHIRLSFSVPFEHIERAVERIARLAARVVKEAAL